MTFRLLFVGDVVGPSGLSATLDLVPKLREELSLDAVVANAENSALGGRGVIRVNDHGVEQKLLAQLRDEVEGRREARGADDVPDKEQAEGQRISPIAGGR